MTLAIASKIRAFFSTGHKRTQVAKKNITVAFITRGISLAASFVIVPLTLRYVGKVEYGIWMIISSIIQWFGFFDIGLSNGLRNKLAEAVALNDHKKARIYISSAFALIALISAGMFITFSAINALLNWNIILNTNIISNKDLALIMMMVVFFFCIEFILRILSSILEAFQRYSLNNIIGVTAQLFGLLAIFILIKTTKGSLFALCAIYSSKTAIVLLIAAIVLFSTSLKEYRPQFSNIKLKESFPLLSLGVKFFIAQILYLVITKSYVILIAQFYGPAEVTVFNLADRYMSITVMIYMMILTPFLSAFTEAYTKKEFPWIKNTISRINKIWLYFSIVTVLLVVFYKVFFHLWVGSRIEIPFWLIVALGVSNVVNMWSTTFSLFMNGIGKIKLQLYILGGQAIVFIPLSYLFYHLNFGLVSIVFAQIFLYLASAIMMTIQYKKLIGETAVGVWAR